MARPTTVINMLVGVVGSFMLGWCSAEGGRAQAPVEDSVIKPTIYVNIDAVTWKTRGRLLYDLEGTILKKVGLAGFQVIRDVTHPHECELLVVYREEQGEQYGVDAWGTTIRGDFRFSGMALSQPVEWNIVEVSENVRYASPPYLDALVKFESHPYYFFLGGLLMSLLHDEVSLSRGLQAALEQRMGSGYPQASLVAGGATAQDHFMDPASVVFQDLAFERALGILEEPYGANGELAPIARALLVSPSRTLRLRAMQVLTNAHDLGSCARVRELAEQDSDFQVRAQATRFLGQCPSS